MAFGIKGGTRAYCGGTFELLHPGHQRFFRWVHDNFDRVIVALNTDDFVARYKKITVQSYAEREENLLGCRWVHEVIPNTGGEDSQPAILAAKPTHIVNGSDWTRERLMQQMNLSESFLAENGLHIVLCPLERIFSTTELKERIRRP